MANSLKRAYRRRGRREWKHARCEEVYGESIKSDLEKVWTREEVVSMARLRSGHSLELAGYRKRIGMAESGECRRCGEGEEDLRHVWECVCGWGGEEERIGFEW